ncbi:NOL1/NOP2/sun family putative RNA methylase [Lachnotalea glycerini]|jgi:NOL1/NOP2/sun family putative RNA methylase|uniref:NOL1/NOP2/sun family putative RNA methylase n=1 Tax=Lachnotalea glycerini TaxID=1763509 RepID=A0A318EHW0_9FIRM|nr:RsmB/NOP family class I SAM-dependent RNA methyltransferase [Lachnotalea glycerini]PXV84732.1 NOL1/NOP2/sun family putative RNA methylase [Lachnotalea glycerini]
MNLPESFVNRMKEILEEEYDDYIRSYDNQRMYGLRVNTSKISLEEFEKLCPFEIHKIPWIPNGYYYNGNEHPAKHPYYYAGMYYLQEPSAMTPASRLDVQPGDTVLDMCAAPGGKATELGIKLKGEGLLVANDISNSRAKALLKNIELFGIPNVFVVNETADKLLTYFEEYFDKILIDAPCSGEGMFRKDPSIISSWEKNGPKFYAKLQREIIVQAARMLKPGGLLLYSTCTFSPEENEGTIQYLLDQDAQFELVELKGYEGFDNGRPELANGSKELSKCVRIWPHKMEAEGHFMALLHKKGEMQVNGFNDTNYKIVKADSDILEEFLNRISMEIDRNYIEVKGQRVFYVSKYMKNLRGVRFLRSGLLLGEIKKNRFEPSQALAMVLKATEFDSIINLSVNDNRTVKYLKGETLDVSDIAVKRNTGWQLVCVDYHPLGWGKLSNGTLKNKYNVSWRWQ